MVSDIELLLETLADLKVNELRDFNRVLQSQVQFHRPHSNIPWSLFMMADLQDTVFLMVPTTGQESVEMAKKVLKKLNRTDLVQRLLDRSSGPTSKTIKTKHMSVTKLIHNVFFYLNFSSERHPGDEHLSALIHNVSSSTSVCPFEVLMSDNSEVLQF